MRELARAYDRLFGQATAHAGEEVMDPNDLRADALAKRTGLRERYQGLRATSRDLNHRLVKKLTKAVIDEGGRKLGLLKRGTLVLNTEDELSVLMDYCIYNVRKKGRTTLESFQPALDPGSDEAICLAAMRQAFYSIFIIEAISDRTVLTIRNALNNERLLLIDLGLAATATIGGALASRVLPFDEFVATGGAALPIPAPSPQRLERLLKLDRPQGNAFTDPAPLIKTLLRSGASDYVRYE